LIYGVIFARQKNKKTCKIRLGGNAMKVILKENIETLGHIGDIVKVAPGLCKELSDSQGVCHRGDNTERQGAGTRQTPDGIQEEQGQGTGATTGRKD
jgi:hypothetical protein